MLACSNSNSNSCLPFAQYDFPEFPVDNASYERLILGIEPEWSPPDDCPAFERAPLSSLPQRPVAPARMVVKSKQKNGYIAALDRTKLPKTPYQRARELYLKQEAFKHQSHKA